MACRPVATSTATAQNNRFTQLAHSSLTNVFVIMSKKLNFRTIYLNCYQYPQCPATGFKNKAQVEEHHKAAHEKNPVQCLVSECEQSFAHAIDFHKHLIASHGPDSGVIFDCTICGITFSGYESLQKHHYMIHRTGAFACVHCQFEATARNEAYQHYAQTHRWYRCQKCNVKLRMQIKGKKHFCRQFACRYSLCGRRYDTVEILKKHEQIHKNEFLLSCKWPLGNCDFKAKTSNHMCMHLKRKHVSEQNPQYIGVESGWLKHFYDIDHARIEESDQAAGIEPVQMVRDNRKKKAVQKEAQTAQKAQAAHETKNLKNFAINKAKTRVKARQTADKNNTQTCAPTTTQKAQETQEIEEANAFQAQVSQELQAAAAAYDQWKEAVRFAQAQVEPIEPKDQAEVQLAEMLQFIQTVYAFTYAKRFWPY